MSSEQIQRIELEMDLEKKNLKQNTKDFKKIYFTKNLKSIGTPVDFNQLISDSEENSYKKFSQWANILEKKIRH